MALFDLPPIAWPDWYKPTKARPASNSRVARGLHPNGLRLLVSLPAVATERGPTCGDCAHMRLRTRTATWAKCPSTMGDGSTRRTDIVRRWAACERFAWVHRAVAEQLAILAGAETRVTVCGLEVPRDQAEVDPDHPTYWKAPPNSGFANIVPYGRYGRPVTCPACLEALG